MHPTKDTSAEMERRLKPRHIMMIALGGTIGSGIFKGSGSSIGLAGPGVILPYLIGGIILFFIMRSMAEIAVDNPDAKTLRHLIEPILGRYAGYSIGWLYWLNWVLVMAAETAAAASFLQYWFPHVSLWALALIVSIVMTLLNVLQVGFFGEMEYWLAGVKIVTLVLFILVGGVLVVTRHAHAAVHNLTQVGGFFPHGLGGLCASMLVVMFSFGGVEMIGMTLGETKDPQKTIVRAVRAVIFRVVLFYVLPILVIVSLVPWNVVGVNGSPFVSVFTEAGIPYVGDIMNAVLLTAVLSAVNTGMYACSRMLYTQAQSGSAPLFFAGLSKDKVPVRAALFSAMFLYIGVVIAVFAKGHTFDILMVYPGYAVMLVWTLLAVARMKSRGITPSILLSFIAILLIFVAVVVTTPIWGSAVALLALLVISAAYFVGRSSRKASTRSSFQS